MGFYPHNVDYAPPVQPTGGGKAVTGGRLADLVRYEVAPQNSGIAVLHAAYTLREAFAKTAGSSVVLETASATDTSLTLTTATDLAINDILKDAAKAEYVRITSITNAPVYTVERAIGSSPLATHAAGASWALTHSRVPITLLATELKACPQLVSVTGTKAGGALASKVIVAGTDIRDQVIGEEITLNDNATVNGVNAYKTVTHVDMPAFTTTGDTVKVGLIKSIGLPWKVPGTEHCVVKYFNGSADSGSVTYDATTLAKNLYNVNGTPDGLKKVVLYIAL